MNRDFLKDIIKYLPSQIVPGIVGFISIPIITRIFLPEDYGHYSLIISTVIILSTLLGWMNMSIIRFYPAYERDRKLDIFYVNIFISACISLAVITILYLIILFFLKNQLSSKLYSLLYIGLGIFVFTGVFNIFQDILRSKRHVNKYSIFAVWKSAGGFGIALLLIFYFNRNISSLLWGQLLSVLFVVPFFLYSIVKKLPSLHFKKNLFLMKEMSKYSFPLVAENLACQVLSVSDRYIIEMVRGSQEVGIYSANYNLVDRSVILVFALFMLAVWPLSMRTWEKEGEAKSKEFMTMITRYYLIVCIPLLIGLAVLSKPLVMILMDEQYVEGYKIIPFITFGVFFYCIQQVFHAGLLYYKKTYFILSAVVAAALLNIVLNFLFIPQYGYFAAAITTLISYVFLLLLIVVFSRRYFVWKFPFKSLIKAISASAIMGIVIYFLSNRLTSFGLFNLMMNVLLGGLIYIVLLFVLREFQAKEKEVMKQTLQKYLPHGLIPNNWKG